MSSQAIATPRIVADGDLAANAASFARALRANNKSPKTVRTYLEAVDRFATFLVARGMPTNVAAISREHVEEFIIDLQAHGKASTAANRYRSLQQFFKFLVEDGEIRESPMVHMHVPKIPESDQMPDVLGEGELRRILATAKGDDFASRRDLAILRVFMGTGARLAEVAGLRWTPNNPETNDVDLDQAIVRVVGKGRRERPVHIGAKAARATDRYLRLRAKHPHAGSPMLWLGQRGPLTASGIAQMAADRGRAAGLASKVHPHQFRHSAADARMAIGMQEGDIMSLMGWRSREMLRRYAARRASDRAIDADRRFVNPGDRL